MDLLNRTNRGKNMNYISKLEEVFISQATVLKFGDFLGVLEVANKLKI